MATNKQQLKRNITNEKKRQQNAAFKASLRTAIKQVEIAVNEENLEAAEKALRYAYKKLDKALAKGIYHRNYINRRKSNLSKLINQIA